MDKPIRPHRLIRQYHVRRASGPAMSYSHIAQQTRLVFVGTLLFVIPTSCGSLAYGAPSPFWVSSRPGPRPRWSWWLGVRFNTRQRKRPRSFLALRIYHTGVLALGLLLMHELLGAPRGPLIGTEGYGGADN